MILGANAAARMVAYNLSYDANVEVIGFVDSDSAKWGTQLAGKPILGGDQMLPDLYSSGIRQAVIGVGEPRIRAKLRALLESNGFELANAIHPSVLVSIAVKVGKGVVVEPGSVLSDNPVVEDNVWIGLAATVSHDTRIGRDSLIGGRSAVGAEVDIGERTTVGWGSVVGPRRKIGSDAVIGFGSNVVTDIPDRAVAIGNPARVIKYRD